MIVIFRKNNNLILKQETNKKKDATRKLWLNVDLVLVIINTWYFLWKTSIDWILYQKLFEYSYLIWKSQTEIEIHDLSVKKNIGHNPSFFLFVLIKRVLVIQNTESLRQNRKLGNLKHWGQETNLGEKVHPFSSSILEVYHRNNALTVSLLQKILFLFWNIFWGRPLK